MTKPSHIIIGTRRSRLALWQANYAADLLRHQFPGLMVELKPISTKGDRIIDRPLSRIGGKGLFTAEIETGLLTGTIDAAVHSLKDVPAELPKGLALTAIPPRGPLADAFVSNAYPSLEALPAGARVGTSSLRRKAQLLALRPDLTVLDLRGNVETRLRRLDDGEYEAIILAAAGLERLGLSRRITARLAPDAFIPAAGQGALAIESRVDDARLRPLLEALDDAATRTAVTAERSFSAAIGGSCQIPAGACARLSGDVLTLSGLIASSDGRQLVRHSLSGKPEEAADLGNKLAAYLLSHGGCQILDTVQTRKGGPR